MNKRHIATLCICIMVGSFVLGYSMGRDHAYLEMLNYTCTTDEECEDKAFKDCEQIYSKDTFGKNMTEQERLQAIVECTYDQKEK